MIIPLPDELEEVFQELSRCRGVVNDSAYSDVERQSMLKLKELGLVDLSWVLTLKGERRVKELLERK